MITYGNFFIRYCDRDIGPATATLDSRPATRDPRLLVKLDKDTFKLCKALERSTRERSHNPLDFSQKNLFETTLQSVFCEVVQTIETGFSLPGFVWIGRKSITYFCKYSNLCEWEALFTISALHRLQTYPLILKKIYP